MWHLETLKRINALGQKEEANPETRQLKTRVPTGMETVVIGPSQYQEACGLEGPDNHSA
jgi:hypothetical protein